MLDFSYFFRIHEWMIYESTNIVAYVGCWYDNRRYVVNADRRGMTRREDEDAMVVAAFPKDDHGQKVIINDERPGQVG